MLSLLTDDNATRLLPIADIRRDGGTQPRDGMSEDVVTDYVAALADGVQFPPVDVMFDGAHYWLFDGFHRVETYLRGGRMAISAHIYNGTLEEAQWRSYAANQSHGLRRSTADKGRAIRAALGHANGVSKSDREIAKHLGVDHKTIGKYRAEMQTGGEIPQVTDRTGGDGKTYNTANIGNRPSKPAPPSALARKKPLAAVAELEAIVVNWLDTEIDRNDHADVLKRTDDDWSVARRNLEAFLDEKGVAWTRSDLKLALTHVRNQIAIAAKVAPTVSELVEPVELPADLVACGWQLRRLAATGRWWCYNANGPRATSPHDTIEHAATAARGMQVNNAAPAAKPAGDDEPALALRRIEQAISELAERLGLDMLRVRLDGRQGNPWSLLASKGSSELNYANDNLAGARDALVGLGRKEAAVGTISTK